MGIGNFLRKTINGVSRGIDWINQNPVGQQVGNMLKQVPGVGLAWQAAKPLVGMAKKTWDIAEPGLKIAQEAYKNKRLSNEGAQKIFDSSKAAFGQGKDTYMAGRKAFGQFKRARMI